jgi:parallel beta-helix repeat protein
MPSSDPYHPRPYITVTNGGKMDILNSRLSHLGYSTGGIADTGHGRAAVEYYNTNDFIVSKSTFDLNYKGIYSFNSSRFKIIGNEIYGQSENGVDAQTHSRDFIVDSNHLHDNGNQGIICSFACRNVTITNNLVDHNVGGIALHWLTNLSTLRDNVVKYNANYGILIQKYSFNNIVENNTSLNNMYGMGLLEGSNYNSITKNIISGNIADEIIHVSPGSKLNLINKNSFE